MPEQLGLFAPKLRGPATCPRVAAPLCRQAAERPGGCIGEDLCERLGAEEVARIRARERQGRWTGPNDGDIDRVGTLLRDLPPERWPFCLPRSHDEHCRLRVTDGASGSFCDCDASDAGSDPSPEELAAPDLGVSEFGCTQSPITPPIDHPPPVDSRHPCRVCGTPTLAVYAPGLRPAELAGPHCNTCADEILRRTNA